MASRAGPGACRAGGETVLVVDDEQAVARLAREVLAGLGYRVLGAHGADEALEVLAGEARLDLLLTDVVMPGVGGPALAQQVQARWPEAHVVFMSGYTAGALEEAGQLPPGRRLLDKPFTAAELVDVVGDALGVVALAA